ncbi:MAG TPA: hypothetical protein VGM77_03410 [Gemmatimonadales bacterium]|jgi:hypothetical protein
MQRFRVTSFVLACVLFGSANIPAQSVPIINNRSPRWKPAEQLRLAPTPSVVIGTQSGEMYEFSHIAGSARLNDGRIVVADGGSSTLRFYDSTGRFIKLVGGHGGGPGEFQSLQTFAILPGDTIVAGGVIRDLSWFTGTGQYLSLRTTTNPPINVGTTGTPMLLAALDGSGDRAVGMVQRPLPRSAGSRWVDSFALVFLNGQNAVTRSLGRVPGWDLAMSNGNPTQPWFRSNATFTSDGHHFYFGYGSEYTIQVYSTTGVLQRIIRRQWTPVPVTRNDINSYATEWGKRWIKSTGAAAEAELASLRGDAYATSVPAFSQFIADRAGRLWVREAHLGDAPGSGALNTMPLVPSRWSLFDDGGHWLGDVTMPARFFPKDIGADYVLGIALDDDDVQTVAVFALNPAGSSPHQSKTN